MKNLAYATGRTEAAAMRKTKKTVERWWADLGYRKTVRPISARILTSVPLKDRRQGFSWSVEYDLEGRR